MENENIKFNNFFNSVLPLFYSNVKITFTDFPFPLLSDAKEDNALTLETICNILLTIASKVHDWLVIDFIFATKPNDSSKLCDYQMILTIVYLIIKDSIGINNKQVLVRFSQLISNQMELKYENEFTYSYNKTDRIIMQSPQSASTILLLSHSNANCQIIGMIKDLIESNNKFTTDYITFSYDSVCFGGSFDHYHIGHNMLILACTLMGKKSINIGVTSDEMLTKKNSLSILQSCNYRIKHITKVLSLAGSKASDIVVKCINDPVSFSGTNKELQALLVTTETVKGGELVNTVRKQNDVPLVDLIILNVIGGNCDVNCKVSSTRIRDDILSKITIDALNDLHFNWKKLTSSLCLSRKDIDSNMTEKTEYWWSVIRDHYMQSWRYYHTLNHVHQMLNDLQNKEVSIELLFAIWFHDIIYIPSRNDNEERSVDIMKECLNDFVISNDLITKANITKIEQYILETKNHLETKSISEADHELKLFLDLDMSIFTSTESEIKQYQSNIRKEYFFVPQEEWITKRGDFLSTLKSKKNIYYTPSYISKQANAIANINILIANLN